MNQRLRGLVSSNGRKVKGVREELGQAIVEFALVAPIVLVLITFIVDAGLLLFANVAITNAVREGARCGAVGGTDAAVTARVTSTAENAGNVLGSPSVTRGATIGSDVVVSVSYTYDWITPVNLIPGLSLADFTYTKQATMRMETTPPYTKGSC